MDPVASGRPGCAWAAHAVGWAMRALEPAEERPFAEHLPHCPECARAVRDAEDLMTALAVASDQADPPPRVRVRLMAAVEATRRSSSPVVRTAEQPGWSRASVVLGDEPRPSGAGHGATTGAARWRRAALAAVAAAVVVLGGGLVARQSSPGPAPVPGPTGVQAQRGEQTRQLLAEVDQPGATHAILSTPDGQPLAAVMRRDGQLDVVAGPRLAPNDPATVYVLWGLAPGGPVALGGFAVSSGERVLTPIGPSSTAAYPGYAVSVEPSGPLPAVPSRVLASGTVVA